MTRRVDTVPRLIPSLCDPFLTAHGLQLRFPRLYIPSTFTRMHVRSVDPTSILGGPVRYHVMDRELVDRLVDDTPLEPRTLRHHVKVMLLECPDVTQMHKDCGRVSEVQMIRYLLGYKKTGSKEELVAIGGYWDPEVDGEDDTDLGVLVKTAVRTCRELTGLDMKGCTRWVKFVDFEYERGGESEKVSFLCPDVWNLMPSDWEAVKEVYAKALAAKEADDAVEKAYDLKDVPCSLVVQASKKAKSGTFFLKSRSLATLLDQGECMREQTFELYLFAECLNGLLASVHARSLLLMLVRVKGLAGSRKRSAPNGSPPAAKKRLNPHGYLIEDAPSYTTRLPKILFAISFFDRSNKRSLTRDQLCSILSLSGYLMSRSEIEAMAKKVLKDDVFYYRNLTDIADGEKMVEFEEVDVDKFIESMEGRKGGEQADKEVKDGKVEFEGQLVDLLGITKRIEKMDVELLDKKAEILALSEEIAGHRKVEDGLRREMLESKRECEELKERMDVTGNQDSFRDAFIRAKHAFRHLWEDILEKDPQ